MSAAPVRVAMLGTGFIAEFRAKVYARLQGAEVVSVLGRDAEKTLAFARSAGIGHAATSWDAARRAGRRSTPSTSACRTTGTSSTRCSPPRPASTSCARSRSA